MSFAAAWNKLRRDVNGLLAASGEKLPPIQDQQVVTPGQPVVAKITATSTLGGTYAATFQRRNETAFNPDASGAWTVSTHFEDVPDGTCIVRNVGESGVAGHDLAANDYVIGTISDIDDDGTPVVDAFAMLGQGNEINDSITFRMQAGCAADATGQTFFAQDFRGCFIELWWQVAEDDNPLDLDDIDFDPPVIVQMWIGSNVGDITLLTDAVYGTGMVVSMVGTTGAIKATHTGNGGANNLHGVVKVRATVFGAVSAAASWDVSWTA